MIRFLKMQNVSIFLLLAGFICLPAARALYYDGDLNHHPSFAGKQEVSSSRGFDAKMIGNGINYQGSEELIMKDRTIFKSNRSLRYQDSGILYPDESARKILVLSSQAGAGKSVLAIYIAHVISQEQRRVLLVNLSRHNQSVRSWIETFTQNIHLKSQPSSPPHHLSGNIVSISPHLDFLDYQEDGEGKFYDIEDSIEYYRAVFEPFTLEYDYLVFDTQTGLNELNLALLRDSDRAILVSPPDASSMSDIYEFIKTSSTFIAKANFYLVINRVIEQKSSLEAHRNLNLALSHFLNSEIELLGLIPTDEIPKNIALLETHPESKPAKHSALAEMREIAQSLLKRSGQQAARRMV